MSPTFIIVIKINKTKIVTLMELVLNIERIYLSKYINFPCQAINMTKQHGSTFELIDIKFVATAKPLKSTRKDVDVTYSERKCL